MYFSECAFKEMLKHCLDEYPNEACGILAGKDEKITKVYKLTNQEKSPTTYYASPTQEYKALKELKTKSLKLLGIYHSHPKTEAYPSRRDIKYASLWNDVLHFIVSLRDIKNPEIKAYYIRADEIREAEFIIE